MSDEFNKPRQVEASRRFPSSTSGAAATLRILGGAAPEHLGIVMDFLTAPGTATRI